MKMKIEKDIVLPHLYLLTFETQYELCMSFVRMQEFYESPKFRNKYFTLEEFMDYWAKEYGHGAFDYPARWNGFNLPSNAIEKWYQKIYDQKNHDTWGGYREREKVIVEAITSLYEKDYGKPVWGKRPKKYYVIGIHKGSSEEVKQGVIDHETAHALYYLYPKYRKMTNALLDGIPKRDYKSAASDLTIMGYGNNVIKDEMQAYFSTNKGKNPFEGRASFAKNLEKFKKTL